LVSTILIDTKERYPYRFVGRDVEIKRVALSAGNYAVADGEATAGADSAMVSGAGVSTSAKPSHPNLSRPI